MSGHIPPIGPPEFGPVTEGTLLMTGAVQTIYEDISNKQGILTGWVDLTPMLALDSVTIQLSVDINDGAGYILHASDTLVGVQAIPTYEVPAKVSKEKIKVTLRQTVGAWRTFGYQFSRRSEA